jgi:hypothetical protein
LLSKALPYQGLAVCPALSCLPRQRQWIANAFSLKYVVLPAPRTPLRATFGLCAMRAALELAGWLCVITQVYILGLLLRLLRLHCRDCLVTVRPLPGFYRFGRARTPHTLSLRCSTLWCDMACSTGTAHRGHRAAVLHC